MALSLITLTDDYVVINKPPYRECEHEIIDQLKAEYNLQPLFCVHRLDYLASGLILYARTKEAAAFFSRLISEQAFHKSYCVVVSGELERQNTLYHYLYKDPRKKKMFPVKRMRKGVKEAVLSYEIISSALYHGTMYNLLHVSLTTGRFHQIRAQMSAIGHPLWGDGKYGSKINDKLALFCDTIIFQDKNGNEVNMNIPLPEGMPWELFQRGDADE